MNTHFSDTRKITPARVIKGPGDILAIRSAMHACEASVAEMDAQAAPGMTEDYRLAVEHIAPNMAPLRPGLCAADQSGPGG